MNSKKDFSDLFDENFEVTYDEDEEISSGFSGDPDNNRYSGQQAADEDPAGDNYTDMYEEYDNSPRNDSDDGYNDGYDDYGSDDSDYAPARRKSGRRRRGGVHLAAPIQKGGRTLSRISGIIIRQLTLILILAISVYVTYTFWRASVPYGDITESIRRKTFSMTLMAYLAIVVLFLLFEFISFFWAMTRIRVRDAGGIRKEDTGRGLTSFIIVFAASYLAFLFNRFVPSSPDLLYGLKGALLVFGSMHNTLLGLCAAGVISCLVRKYLVQ